MYFDWITWSIWLIGFIILVVWIIVPVKEFKKIIQQKRIEQRLKKIQNQGPAEGGEFDNN